MAINFAVIIALARLLAPAAFGLLAMIAVITGFATLFTDVGFGAALIQRQELDERHRSSVFWLSLAIGCGLMLVTAAASPVVAWFFKQPVLVGLTMLASLDFLFTSMDLRRDVPRYSYRVLPLKFAQGGSRDELGCVVKFLGSWVAIWPMGCCETLVSLSAEQKVVGSGHCLFHDLRHHFVPIIDTPTAVLEATGRVFIG